jgi:hypothetical protein
MSEPLVAFEWERPKRQVSPSELFWEDGSDEEIAASLQFAEVHGHPSDIETERRDARVLMISNDVPMERYEPLTDAPGLFREFAALKATEQSFLEFTAKYGVPDSQTLRAGPGLSEVWTFGQFWAEQLYLRIVIGKFEGPKSRRKELLPRLNGRLSGLTDTALGRGGGVTAYVEPAEFGCGYRLRLRPHSLINAMWLQLVEQMTGVYSLRQCKGCGKWFKAGDPNDPTSKRSDATLCDDDSCKMRARRKRERERKGRRRR